MFRRSMLPPSSGSRKKMSVSYHNTARRHDTEDLNFNLRRRENLRSHALTRRSHRGN